MREMNRSTKRRIAYLVLCALSGASTALAQTPAAPPLAAPAAPADTVQHLPTQAQEAGYLQRAPEQTVSAVNGADPDAYVPSDEHDVVRTPPQPPHRETDLHALQREEAHRAFEFPAHR
jgi:hypothetical protein